MKTNRGKQTFLHGGRSFTITVGTKRHVSSGVDEDDEDFQYLSAEEKQAGGVVIPAHFVDVLKCRGHECNAHGTRKRSVDDGTIFNVEITPHIPSCESSPDFLEARTVEQEIILLASTPGGESLATVYDRLVPPLRESVRLLLRTKNELANLVSVRKKSRMPAVPDNIRDLALPLPAEFANITRSHGQQPLTFFRDKLDLATGETVMIFCTDRFLRLLCSSKNLAMDSTFKSAPYGVYQYFTIHTRFAKKTIARIHVLMTHKTTAAYSAVFNWIRLQAATLSPDDPIPLKWEKAMADFELGQATAIDLLYPPVGKEGCQFHYCQAVWLHVVNVGLKVLYNADGDVRSFVKCIYAIPFVPIGRVMEAYNAVLNHFDRERHLHPVQMNALVTYLDNQWFNNPNMPLSSFNCFLLGEYRTNNAVEGFNLRVYHHFGYKPTFWDWILKCHSFQMQDEDIQSKLEIGQGHNILNKQTTREKQREQTIIDLKDMLMDNDITLLDYVLRVSGMQIEYGVFEPQDD